MTLTYVIVEIEVMVAGYELSVLGGCDILATARKVWSKMEIRKFSTRRPPLECLPSMLYALALFVYTKLNKKSMATAMEKLDVHLIHVNTIH